MSVPGCWWNRSRLEAYADGALEGRAARSVASHIAGCPGCRVVVARARELGRLVRGAAVSPEEPDWTGFWEGVRARVAVEPARPMREGWWLPLWKPVWGHPRLATLSAAMAVLLLSFSLWPGRSGEVPLAWAGPVVVQEASTPDPDGTVMVYSTPERDVTVVWVFASDSP